MKVKELIIQLLEQDMDSEVQIKEKFTSYNVSYVTSSDDKVNLH